MKSVNFVSDGKKFKVKSQIIGTELWLHVNGETHIIDLRPKSTSSSGTSDEAASGMILAPMPGKILKIRYSVGDSVEAKKVIVIMEAMKMEYSLAAPFAGKIKEINCQEGQQVTLHQKLAVIEAVQGE